MLFSWGEMLLVMIVQFIFYAFTDKRGKQKENKNYENLEAEIYLMESGTRNDPHC